MYIKPTSWPVENSWKSFAIRCDFYRDEYSDGWSNIFSVTLWNKTYSIRFTNINNG